MNAVIHKPLKQIYLFFSIALLLAGCGRDKKVDVSNIAVNITVARFDHDLDQMRTKPMVLQAAVMQKRYGIFYRDYIERILQLGSVQDTAYFAQLRNVFKSRSYQDLKSEVDKVYPDLNDQDAALTDAFRRIKYYFPRQHIPQFYAYFSGFQAQTSIGDRYYAIGLDLFLGAGSKFYFAPGVIENFPRYTSRRFTPANIAPRAVEGFARDEMFPEDNSDRTLLSKMIYNGKLLYFMDMTLPDVADSVKIGYTAKQMQWCQDFKGQIWAYLVDENLLYESDNLKIQKYINEAPFTPGLGEHNESAPKVGVWTGWQMVRQYMDKHPQVTLAQLMAATDAQQILNGSKYRPK